MRGSEELIDRILDIEQDMFVRVNEGNPAACQRDTEGFRLHREAQFSVWSQEALASYLDDLRRAADAGENLMTYKYARMEGLVERKHDSPHIDDIVDMQTRWQSEMFRRYPILMSNARPIEDGGRGFDTVSFQTYLRGELESYSEKTLGLLHRDMKNMERAGRNMSETVYDYLVRRLGYSSIQEAEDRKKKQAGHTSREGDS
jgi:hypothetical protein